MPEFRLRRVLEIKEKLREDREKRLEEAHRAVMRLREHINTIDEEYGTVRERVFRTSMDGRDFLVVKDYLSRLEQDKKTLRIEEEKMQEQIDGLRSELLTLHKEVKMLETLKARDDQTFRKEAARRQQRQLDALAGRKNA